MTRDSTHRKVQERESSRARREISGCPGQEGNGEGWGSRRCGISFPGEANFLKQTVEVAAVSPEEQKKPLDYML